MHGDKTQTDDRKPKLRKARTLMCNRTVNCIHIRRGKQVSRMILPRSIRIQRFVGEREEDRQSGRVDVSEMSLLTLDGFRSIFIIVNFFFAISSQCIDSRSLTIFFIFLPLSLTQNFFRLHCSR